MRICVLSLNETKFFIYLDDSDLRTYCPIRKINSGLFTEFFFQIVLKILCNAISAAVGCAFTTVVVSILTEHNLLHFNKEMCGCVLMIIIMLTISLLNLNLAKFSFSCFIFLYPIFCFLFIKLPLHERRCGDDRMKKYVCSSSWTYHTYEK